jgi:aryl-alcohol dehydrogenase-like predicted oxidoreductase
MSCSRCGREIEIRTFRPRRGLVLAPWALGLGLSWWLAGGLLHDVVEGMESSLLPVWKLWVSVLALVAAVTATALRLHRPVCPGCRAGVPGGFVETAAGSTRRAILRAGAAAVAASVGGVAAAVGRNAGWIAVGREIFNPQVETSAPNPRPEWGDSRIKGYRRLGRTNAMVSDISLGSGRIHDQVVPEAAIERGVTYIDTAPDYADAGSETILGEVMKGRRDKIFLATKFCRPDGHLPNDTPVPQIIAAVEQSLARLKTDHVDLIHIHSCDRVDRLMAPNIHEAFDRLKEQGKARFLGVSTHTPNLEEVANTAIDSGRFDVMMLAYHFGMWPSFEHILEKAKQHDVGVVAMKTLKGARHADLARFRDDAGAYSQAAFRWVLSNPNVSCLVISFFELRHVDEYLAASGTSLRAEDVAVLERYDQLVRGDYCQPHCGLCLDSCPERLPINDVLRYRMYSRDYGWEREGMRLYATLDRNASLCASCPAPCAGTCPHGVPIRTAMMDAHRRLTL